MRHRWMAFLRYGPLALRFDAPCRLVVNPGHWQQLGTRQGG